MKKIALLIIALSTIFISFGQISGTVNSYTKVNSFDLCGNKILVDSEASFSEGDAVLIIQMKGVSISTSDNSSFGTITDYNNAGNYEVAEVAFTSTGAVHLKHEIIRDYDVSGSVQLVRVPQYEDVSIDGTLSGAAWDGEKGGVLALKVDGTLTMNANIDMSGKGFRGGVDVNAPTSCGGFLPSVYTGYATNLSSQDGAMKGEGVAAYNTSYEAARGALANGGGGGNDHNAGGGGGSNSAFGGRGGDRAASFWSCPGNGGRGGHSLVYYTLYNKVFLGGGGGAGHGNNGNATSGSAGGGSILIMADEIVGNNYSIISNGPDNENPAVDDGAGGGGAGGTLLLDVENFTGVLTMELTGGDGALAAGTTCNGPGGGGAGGVIWLKTETLPPSVSSDLSGGDPGFTVHPASDCYGSTNNAVAGGQGNVFIDLDVPVGTVTAMLADAGEDTTVCDGGGVTLNGSGGLSYSWSPSSTLSDPTSANPIANPTETTTYTLTTTDALGCTSTDEVEVEITPGFTLEVEGDTVLCSGSSTTISASGGTEYLWSPISGLSDPESAATSANPSTTTLYTVVSTNEAGCSQSEAVLIEVESDFASAGSSGSVCEGESITLNASGGVAYSWASDPSLSSTTIADPVASPEVETTYNVSVTTANGCTESSSVTISVNPVPEVTLTPGAYDPVCPTADPILLSGGSPAGGTWSGTGVVLGTFLPSVAGTGIHPVHYNVTATNGCIGTATAFIEVLDDLPPSITCPSSIDINATGDNCSAPVIYTLPMYTDDCSNVTLSIESGFSSGSTFPSGTTTVSYTATDEGGNSSNCSFDVTVTTNMVASAVITDAMGSGFANGAIDVSITGGAEPYNYTWSNGAETEDLTDVTAGSYTLTVTDELGCSIEEEFIISEIAFCPAPPAIIAKQLSTTGVLLQWTPIPGALGYQIKGRPQGATGWGSVISLSSIKTVGGLTTGLVYEWKVRAKCSDGVISAFTPLDTFYMSFTTEKLSSEQDDNVVLYPNPATDIVNLDFFSNHSEKAILSVYSLDGIRLKNNSINLDEGWNHLSIPIDNLPSGSYFISIQSNSVFVSKHFVSIE